MKVASSIRPTRTEVSDRFPVAGFTVRTGGPAYFEVAVASDPALFLPEHRQERDVSNFYSTRDTGPLPADGGEAVYLLPTSVLTRFAGRDRLYYAMAAFEDPTRANPEVTRIAPEAAPSIAIARSFTGRPRAIGAANVRGGLTGYQGRGRGTFDWAGDALTPGLPQPVAVVPVQAKVENGFHAAGAANGAKGSNGHAAAVAPAPVKAQQLDVPYDDGYGPLEGASQPDGQDDGPGIEGPIPDAAPSASPQAYARPASAAQYPQASRFVAADHANFRATSSPRTIRRIVIHITDGGANINGTIGWFQNPRAGVSAHYIVGQDGEVVQMVRHEDVAWHAHTANGDSIGIEHVANTRGLAPTEAQYCASAALVNWLCAQFSIEMNRTNVLGHAEADPHTTHSGCPNTVWEWDYYMGLVTSATCYPRSAAQSLSFAAEQPERRPRQARAAVAGAGRSRPLDDGGGYFTDTNELNQYMADTRASDSRMVSTREDAHATVAAMRNSGATSPWTSLSRSEVADRLDELIDDPRRVRQGALNLCGPAAFFCMWAGRDPAGFATFGTQLFDTGCANIGSMRIAPTDALKQKDYAQMLQRMGGSVSPQADWMLLGALKNSDDPFWQPRWEGDPNQQVAGMTTPEDLTSWLNATGVWRRVSNEANWATNRGIPHASNILFASETDVAMLLNVNMLAHADAPQSSPETSWILSQFPNHYVMLVNEIVPSEADNRVDLSIWSWGRTIVHMRVPTNDFINNYYGAIVCSGLRQSSTSQSLGTATARRSPGPAPRSSTRPFDYTVLDPGNVPADPQQAQQFLQQWTQRRERWRAGIDSTRIQPYSAICQLVTNNGMGTGFYIGPNHILTAGHVVRGATSLRVIPGKNDLDTPSEPFGSFTVNPGAITVHSRYAAGGNRTDADFHNFDLAVIRVDTPPPNGFCFDILEELNQSQPSPILVCGYAAEAGASPNRQHLDGGAIQFVQDETFEYDIQTTGGTSGSPVFYAIAIDDEQAQVCRTAYKLVGVHVDMSWDRQNGTWSNTTNLGCRLTADKIAWISGFLLSPPAQSLAARNGSPRQALGSARVRAAEAGTAQFGEPDVTRMRKAANVNAATAQASGTDTVAFLNAALRQLYSAALRNADGTDKPLGATVQDTMAALQGYGLAQPKSDFEFVDTAGGLTRGVARPDRLRDSVEESIGRAPAMPGGWNCFGMALLDGYHGVILATSGGKTYWVDQIHGGFDEVTGELDRRIAECTQGWWDPEDAARKPRTRVSVWPLTPQA